MKTKQWTHRLLAKIIAFFLVVIMACVTVGCVIGAMALIQESFYTRSINEIKEDGFYPIALNAGKVILNNVLNGESQNALTYCDRNNLFAVVSDDNGGQLWSNYKGTHTSWEYTFSYNTENDDNVKVSEGKIYTVKIYINDKFPKQNQLSLLNMLINVGFTLRYWIYIIGILSLVLAIASFVFLMCSAGHKEGQEEVIASGLAKVPLDLLTVLLLIVASIAVSDNNYGYYLYNEITTAIVFAAGFIVSVSVVTAYCMSLAVRIKLGGWWKNTVIYQLGRLIFRGFKTIRPGFSAFVRNLPLVWKTALLLTGITIIEFLAFVICYRETDVLVFLWFLEKIVLVPAILYLALVLRKLQKGSEALAQGDLSYQVDTKRMFWDFKQHGKNLNSIGLGMTHAVDDRLKSEHLKTELITNVSHDIKTPLTSIINYSDLICREKTSNEKVAEYADVLHRQSERLKKLIEDLVEASKASTGNVDILLAPCEVGVMLTQTVGEYEQRLRDNHLELITKQPETPVKIMADGRHLWRVFDNLMNNICKYAQDRTRVYLNVEEESGEAVISFKNISKYPLDISTEELMERFVRGDSSRNTDGNGLGLSIAQSLTELQNGKLKLTVDGDLFKVVLRFQLIS